MLKEWMPSEKGRGEDGQTAKSSLHYFRISTLNAHYKQPAMVLGRLRVVAVALGGQLKSRGPVIPRFYKQFFRPVAQSETQIGRI